MAALTAAPPGVCPHPFELDADLQRLDDALAAHEREIELELGQALSPSGVEVGPSMPAEKRRMSIFSPVPCKRVNYGPAEWRDRAFPGLAERRWLQLLVDEEIYVWADPVTFRQFMPELDIVGCYTGEFVEIDCDHPCFIDKQTLTVAIRDHKRFPAAKKQTKSGSKGKTTPAASSSLSDKSDVTGETGGDADALSPAPPRLLPADNAKHVSTTSKHQVQRRVVRSLEL
eukprot:jgi/Tetstr1/422272/TSEL_013117.t1